MPHLRVLHTTPTFKHLPTTGRHTNYLHSAAAEATADSLTSATSVHVAAPDAPEYPPAKASLFLDALDALRWMFEEGTEVSYCLDMIKRTTDAAQRQAVADDADLRGKFVKLCNDEEMLEVITLLQPTVERQLEWLLDEGTSFDVLHAVVSKAPDDAARAAVAGNDFIRKELVSLLRDDEMRDLMAALGGDARFQLAMMVEEGTEWSAVQAVIEAHATKLASVYDDTKLSLALGDLLDDPGLLAGLWDITVSDTLRFRLATALGAGASLEQLEGYAGSGGTAAANDALDDPLLRDAFVSEVGDDGMKKVLGKLVRRSSSKHHEIEWLAAEGVDWGELEPLVRAAPDPDKKALLGGWCRNGSRAIVLEVEPDRSSGTRGISRISRSGPGRPRRPRSCARARDSFRHQSPRTPRSSLGTWLWRRKQLIPLTRTGRLLPYIGTGARPGWRG